MRCFAHYVHFEELLRISFGVDFNLGENTQIRHFEQLFGQLHNLIIAGSFF